MVNTSGGEGDPGDIRFQVSADVDSSGIDRAAQSAERFEGSIADLERQLESLRQQAVQSFNALAFPGQAGRSGAGLPDYAALQRTAGAQPQQQAAFAAGMPDVAALMERVRALEQMRATGAVTGGPPGQPAAPGTAAPPAAAPPGTAAPRTAPPGTAAPPAAAAPAQALGDRPEFRAQQPPTPAEEEPAEQETPAERRRRRTGRPTPEVAPFSTQLMDRVVSARGLTMAGMFAQGNVGMGGQMLARSFLEALVASPVPGVFRAAFRATAAGAVSAGAETALGTSAGTTAAATTARTLGDVLKVALASSLGIGALTAGAAAAGVLGLDAVRAQARSQEYVLRSNVGGLGYTQPVVPFATGVINTGRRFQVEPGQALQTAATLGAAGVTAAQMPGALGSTLAFARGNQLDVSQVTRLASTLLVAGRMTTQQLSETFQSLQEGALRSGESISKLVDAVGALGGAGQAAITPLGVSGLAAANRVFGPAINAGQLVSQPMQATGFEAVRTAGFLGISQAALERVQETGDTARMADIMASRARRMAGGRTDQATINTIEGVFQQMGVLQTAGIAPGQATRLIRTMLTQPAGAVEAEAARIRQAGPAQTQQQYLTQQAQAITNATSQVDQFRIGLLATTATLKLLNNEINTTASLQDQMKLMPAPADVQLAKAGVTPGGGPGVTSAGGASRVQRYQRQAGMPYTDATGHPLQISNTRGSFDTVVPNMAQAAYAARRYNVPMSVLLATMARESDFDPHALNPSGARGIAQFKPSTLDYLRTLPDRDNPLRGMSQAQAMQAAMDPSVAIQAQAFYLRRLRNQFGGDMGRALAAYGEGPTYAAQVLQAAGGFEQANPDLASYGGPLLRGIYTPQPTGGAAMNAPGADIKRYLAPNVPSGAQYLLGGGQPTGGTGMGLGQQQVIHVDVSGTMTAVNPQNGRPVATGKVAPKRTTVQPSRAPKGDNGRHNPAGTVKMPPPSDGPAFTWPFSWPF